jgi:hypothetical protein
VTETEESAGAPPRRPLPPRVRTRVVEIASVSLGRMAANLVPGPLARVASFAPARRAKIAGDAIATALEADEAFRERVAEDARSSAPELATMVQEGSPPAAADPVEVAALAYLLRPDGWAALVEDASEALAALSPGVDLEATRQLEQLRRQVDALNESAKEGRARHREQLAQLKAENADLRHKLGDARARGRRAEADLAAAADDAG